MSVKTRGNILRGAVATLLTAGLIAAVVLSVYYYPKISVLKEPEIPAALALAALIAANAIYIGVAIRIYTAVSNYCKRRSMMAFSEKATLVSKQMHTFDKISATESFKSLVGSHEPIHPKATAPTLVYRTKDGRELNFVTDLDTWEARREGERGTLKYKKTGEEHEFISFTCG